MPRTKDKVFIAVEVDPDLKAGLDAIKERDGIPLNFQVTKAIEGWLELQGIHPTVKRKRPEPRKVGGLRRSSRAPVDGL